MADEVKVQDAMQSDFSVVVNDHVGYKICYN